LPKVASEVVNDGKQTRDVWIKSPDYTALEQTDKLSFSNGVGRPVKTAWGEY
jgi:hypothetical protein